MKQKKVKMMSKTIAVHCGHGVSLDGSWDSGCVYKGHSEAKLMLAITKAAVKYLRASGVKVQSDADHGNNKNMIADVRQANNSGVAMYLSIHCDYSGAPRGVMPLYVSGSGKKLAKCLEKTIKKEMGMKITGRAEADRPF
jgi:N-acetylmuramoyl-L-alanine amidase